MARRSLGLIAKASSLCCGFGGSAGLSLPWVSFSFQIQRNEGRGEGGVHPLPVLLEVTVCFMAESPF